MLNDAELRMAVVFFQGSTMKSGKGIELHLIGPHKADVFDQEVFVDPGALLLNRDTSTWLHIMADELFALEAGTSGKLLPAIILVYSAGRHTQEEIQLCRELEFRVPDECQADGAPCLGAVTCGNCLERDSLKVSQVYRSYNSDTNPERPILEILCSMNSTCQAAPDGVWEEVIIGANWDDPGFRARDSQGRDVGRLVQSFGAKAISTGMPTDPDDPYIIEYSFVDSECEVSDTLYRRLSVVCPQGEFFCDVNGARSCGNTPLCAARNIEVLQDFQGSPPVFVPPSIHLNGNQIVEVDVG